MGESTARRAMAVRETTSRRAEALHLAEKLRGRSRMKSKSPISPPGPISNRLRASARSETLAELTEARSHGCVAGSHAIIPKCAYPSKSDVSSEGCTVMRRMNGTLGSLW